MEDLLAMKDTARRADLQRKHRGPDWTGYPHGKNSIKPPRRTTLSCQDCDLWWWAQKLQSEALHLRGVERPVIEGDFRSNFNRYMHRRKGHELGGMTLEDYKALRCP